MRATPDRGARRDISQGVVDHDGIGSCKLKTRVDGSPG
jgi:hypothetical protein